MVPRTGATLALSAALIAVAVAVPHTRGNPSARLFAAHRGEGGSEWRLPFLEVGMEENGKSEQLKKGIEAAGSWWTHIGDRLYSPVANLLETSNGISLVEEGEALQASHMSSRSLEGFFVAIGGSKNTLPEEFQGHHVGGSDPYHILYMPNVTASEREGIVLASLQNTLKSQGNRRRFHSLIKLEKGFTPYQQFVGDRQYKSPLSDSQSETEKNMVSKLTNSMFETKLRDLVDSFKTRSVHNGNREKIVQYLQSKFKNNKNLVTCKQPVDVGGLDAYNVLAFAFSSNPSAKYVAVGAHYDSRPYSGNAPGAEDNGSGVAALLSMGELYDPSLFSSKHHVVFSAFTGEEEGLYGSSEFVREFGSWGEECQKILPKSSAFVEMNANASVKLNQSSRTDLDKLVGAIIMDEIGWASEKFKQHTVTLETRAFSKPVMEHLYDSSQTHNSDLKILRSLNPFGSDHMPFLNEQQKAVLTINGDDEAYPAYHQSTDTIDNIDFDLGAKIARMNIGGVIRLAQQ